MQDIDHNMDDLFRKAAKEYSPKLCASKWDELAPRLISSSFDQAGVNKQFAIKQIRIPPLYFLGLLVSLMIPSNFINKHKTKIGTIAFNKVTTKNEQRTAAPVKNSQGNELYGKPDKSLDPINGFINKYDPYTKKIELSSNQRFDPEFQHRQGQFTIQIKRKEIASNNRSASRKVETGTFTINLASTDTRNSPIALIQILQKSKPIPLNSTPNLQEKSSLIKPTNLQSRGFYFGSVVGPLLSQVRPQELKTNGFDFGILLGYNVSSKISIETGLIRTAQYYFVGGKYYNSVSGDSNVKSLEGKRNALEIPIKINYNIVQGTAGNLFVSGGLSSYIGINDKIQIDWTANSSPSSQKFEYRSACYLPSYLIFAIGYECKIGNHASVRIEPYSQIPLRHTSGNSFKVNGTSPALQIFNAGLHLGINWHIH